MPLVDSESATPTLVRVLRHPVTYAGKTVSEDQIGSSALFYIRVASFLQDESLFRWALDKSPLFSTGFCSSVSSQDMRLGDLPAQVQPFPDADTFTTDEWKLVLMTWNSWLLERAAKSRAEHRNVDASILALHSIAVSHIVLPYWSYKFTPLVAEKAKDYLMHSLIDAKEIIARHMTVDQNELLGFRLNNHGFFQKYGYPWHYQSADDTDAELFMFVATTDLLTMDEDLSLTPQQAGCRSGRDTVDRADTILQL
ncbi:hypothetical protein AUEXF2481DRAFT_85178 [Aureobasidium subglaciale EXF-2481]|uniref:Uncharacterized protein n=1 Tax=Aureobasidium subglaciale (strain EXF-2481) TaxID=1043005 RepID=A0A074YTW4_AURSE|nr:uncharacterized protein AUEXF2481DRAFT_85178 [Aureobasidium subglaciale EXF-2481]KEQ99589.1 hypothetical protein AUEXF2481DRAFT_85178 [Aureobasidium subglaciale EXF-2481]